MLVAAIILRWCHIICAIAWFGGSLYRVMVLLPGVARQPGASQRALARQFHEQQETLLITAALLVILFGILLGTVVGPLQTADMLFTWYGLTWIGALVLAGLLLTWEGFVVGRAQERFLSDDAAWQTTSARYARQRIKSWRRIITLAWGEMVGFGLILLFMVLLHYGL
jgi:uncharacterized membrane protein